MSSANPYPDKAVTYRQSGQPEPERHDPATTDRLDQISQGQLERILKRAIELQQDEDWKWGHEYDQSDLESIAVELGIDPQFVRKAAIEERTKSALTSLEPAPLTPLEKFLAPNRMAAQARAGGTRREVQRDVGLWMRRHEGLRPRRLTDDGAVWDKDTGIASALRRGLKVSQGTGSLREMSDVEHSVTSLADDEHVVTIEADTSVINKVAAGIAAGGAALAVGTGIAVASSMGGSGLANLAEFSGGFLGVMALNAGIALTVAKSWASSVRRGLQRAVDGVTHPQLYETQAHSTGDWWSKFKRDLSELADDIEDIFD